MRILFEDASGEARTMTSEIVEREVVFTLRKDLNDKEFNQVSFSMPKEQLSDFIGGLLHLQQKLNKGGRNV